MSWDVIVVGARCAGAPLARFLARGGKRVLLVDSAAFPSDQPMSTHFIQPFGMRILDELGVGDRVRAIAPDVNVFTQGMEDAIAKFQMPFGGNCPRRTDLDHMLIEAAREVGAEIKLGYRVVDVLRDGERVVGVVAQDRDGNKHSWRASWVVGADGRSSTIADLVGAEKYFNYVGPRAFYWGYWPRPKNFDEAPYFGGTRIQFVDRRIKLMFPCNRDQILIGVGFPNEDAGPWRENARKAIEAAIREDKFYADLIAGSEPIGKVIGFVKIEYFFRRAAGPGWALVGDAGLFKDPTPGLGISDAFRDARALAAAISEGSDAALERYWRQRDVESFELFNFGKDMGELDYNNPLTQTLFRKLAQSDALHGRIVDVLERRCSPYNAFKPLEVMKWTFGALLRGRFGVLKPFFKFGKRHGELMKELTRRRALVTPALPSAVEQAAA